MIPSIIYLPAIIGIVLIGMMTVYQKGNRGVVFFSGMAFSMSIWLFFQYLAQLFAGKPEVLTLIRASSAISNLMPVFFYIFVRRITAIQVSKKSVIILSSLATILFAVNFTGLMITEASSDAWGISVESAGSLYFAQILFSFVLYVYGLVRIMRYGRKASGPERQKYRILAFAVGQALIVTVLGSTVLATSRAIQILIVQSFFIMVIMIGYAIVRHKLFDIKLIVARSIAYLLLVFTLSSLFAFTVFGIANNAFGHNTFTDKVVPIVAALLLAFTTPYLRRQFDRFTNRLFYRDAYEPQQFLDDLNNVLVTNIDLQELLSKACQVIGTNLKSEFCVFGIRETAYEPQRQIGDRPVEFSPEDIEAARRITPYIHQKIIATEYIQDDLQELKSLLQKNKIAVLARLTSTTELEIEGIGYLVLGYKKSGNPYNKQDIQILEIVANELVIAIQNALRFEEIEKFNATLQDKVDDATARLKRTNDKLKAMDETKDEFISMASHQLRTPLTSVKGYLSMVLEGDAGELSEMQRKLLDQAFTSSQRMVYLIADLLNVSRLRTGKFVIETTKTNLADVVEGEAAQLKETAKARGLELTYEKPENFPELMLDETKIRQVVMNFMDNAIYYTPSGGHIRVELKDMGNTVEYTVNDDGIGVPKSEQHHLFTKFYRAGNAKKARPDGTGLGLFMAKKVVVAQGGNIVFHSEDGKGSTFGFSFEKAPLMPPSEPSN